MKSLAEQIDSAAAKAGKYRDRKLGEQNTKASLIEPLLESLGWDIRDPDEVHREFRPTGRDSPVDYALKILRKPRLFLEAKGLGETLADRRWIAQVLGYATVAGVEWCVLTDGDEYRFYNATAPVDAEEKMFCRVRLTESRGDEAERALSLMSRANLEQNLLDMLWVSHFVDRRVKAALTELLNTPGRSLVRLVRDRAPKLTSKEIAESIGRLDVRIDSPVPLEHVRPARPEARAARRRGARTLADTTLMQIAGSGVVSVPLSLFRRYKGRDLQATLRPDGMIEFEGRTYVTCSAAAEAARETVAGRRMNTNGWTFWQFSGPSGHIQQLDVLRRTIAEERSAKGGQPSLRLAGGDK